MGRSKNLHFVQHTIEVTQPDDPHQNWAEGIIQVDVKLSEELGRTIRNGNSFRLVGYGATLKGFYGGSDQDIGFAGVANIQYCPVTKNGVGAWQAVQKQWMQQKRLGGRVGKYVRYDDFEVGWSDDHRLGAGRNSVYFAQGMGDISSEEITIYGQAIDGDFVSLEDWYNSRNPIPQMSKDAFGAIIKLPKYVDKFPDLATLNMPTTFSAGVEPVLAPLFDNYPNQIAMGDIQWLPSDNHLSHMTGTLYYYFKGVAPDTTGAVEDQLRLTITLVYEGWATLAKIRSSRAVTKRIPTTARSSKKTTKARRRS